MKVFLKSAVLVCIIFNFVQAQDRPNLNIPQGANLEVPEGWEVRLDHDMDDVEISADVETADIFFAKSNKGWHIKTGPAAIFYHPENTATGSYTLSSELHLFDPGERNREAYGIFFGGENLANENQEYIYFLIRNTGDFLIKKRIGNETKLIKDWTSSDNIVLFKSGTTKTPSVKNTISAEVSSTDISFHINGKEVASVPTSGLKTDGLFGLRVNHSINLQISSLNLTPMAD